MIKTIAITGATGMIGSEIVSQLLGHGYNVRILTRNIEYQNNAVEIIYGDINNQEVLSKLLLNADALFHCAAELKNPQNIWASNVEGTKKIIEAAEKQALQFICYLSSVGVIGKTDCNIVNESTSCFPMNLYEKSKYEAEKIIQNYKGSAKVVILRPTNVVDHDHHSLNEQSLLKLIFKGGEQAHLIHAKDVAASAIYFLNNHSKMLPGQKECFIVNYPLDSAHTYAGCVSLYRSVKFKTNLPIIPHLHWIVPYLLRKLASRASNKGNIYYSSEKLMNTGFRFPLGFHNSIKEICENIKR